VTFPLIDPNKLPRSMITAPMTIRNVDIRMDRFTTILAGTIGMAVSGDDDIVAPVLGWWVTQEFMLPIPEE